MAGLAKLQWHYSVGRDYAAFARLLLEIALTVNASLHILDGIIGMDGNGPSNGRVRELNLLMAGTNPIALDRVTVEVLRKNPEQFPIFKAARELNVQSQCPVQAISLNHRIRIDAKRCIRCCCCQEICPVGALSINDPLLMKILKKIWLGIKK